MELRWNLDGRYHAEKIKQEEEIQMPDDLTGLQNEEYQFRGRVEKNDEMNWKKHMIMVEVVSL